MIRIVLDVLIAIGVFFAFAGVVGILRMPDTFCRMQSSTNITTFGVIFVLLAAIIYCFFVTHNYEMGVKAIVLCVFYIVTNPIAANSLAKAAYCHNIRPDKPMEVDQWKEDLEEC